MRWTPHGLIIVGVGLVIWAVLGVGSGITSDGLHAAVSATARQASERISNEELKRVFEMPDDVTDKEAWIKNHCGLFWARGLQQYVGLTVLGSLALGLLMCVWGVIELRVRKQVCRQNSPTAA